MPQFKISWSVVGGKHTRGKDLLAATTLIGTMLITLGSAHATAVVWDFSSPSGTLGVTQSYNSTPGGGGTIVASGFTTAGATVTLFGKAGAGDEKGLGLTNDPSGEDEITPGSFVQLDISGLTMPPLTSVNMSFAADSTTSPDAWQVFGTNSAGTLSGATSLLTGTTENIQSLTGVVGTYKYLDVTATQGNILVKELDNNINAVPAPAIGHGLPVALGLTGMLLGAALLRRSRKSPGSENTGAHAAA